VISENNNDKNVEYNILIVTKKDPAREETYLGLSEKGYILSTVYLDEFSSQQIDDSVHDLVIVSGDSNLHTAEIVRKIKQNKSLLTVVLVKKDMLLDANGYLNMVDDFLIWPCDARELIIRIDRLLRKPPDVNYCEQIKCRELTIDLANCEVMVNGTKAELTFKEYELLKLMAGNKGRVFTRQTLLDRIWGYDYFGGDRTVDVHVRRLRSKIENTDHTYIETVRNIGYRFAKDVKPG
jgi:DNA-binding response OmpR family regulator